MELDLASLQDALDLAGEIDLEFAGTVIGGPPGPVGPRNNFTVGTVAAAPYDTLPEVNILGTFPNFTLNFVLPMGNTGSGGDTGPQGSPGTGTSVIYRSTIVPTNDDGNDGDFWFVLI